jgi:hypothetical protein
MTLESTDRRSLALLFIMTMLSLKHMLLHLDFGPRRLYLALNH